MFLQIWFLPLSFLSLPPSVSLALCICLHLPSSSPGFLSPSSMHTHTYELSQASSLVVGFIVWSVSPFSPSALPFVFCMFCCIVQRGWDADRMQTVCCGWGAFICTSGSSWAKHIRLCPHNQLKTIQDLLIYVLHPLCLGNLSTLHDLIQCQDAFLLVINTHCPQITNLTLLLTLTLHKNLMQCMKCFSFLSSVGK